ncbi:MAG: HNH endonuclease signature motif containing protein, partial [Candidatus Nanopelagicales bacterium]
GRTTYRIPDPLRAFITARDGTCRFPGCRRRADRCQVDHAQPWDHGGPTSRDNLGNPKYNPLLGPPVDDPPPLGWAHASKGG